jgi:hypothetical protein
MRVYIFVDLLNVLLQNVSYFKYVRFMVLKKDESEDCRLWSFGFWTK